MSKCSLIACVGFLFLNSVHAGEMRPSFPNNALVLLPDSVDGRGSPSAPVDPSTPFSWPQVQVVKEGQSGIQRVIGGYDPGFAPTQIIIEPYNTTLVKILGFDGNLGLINTNILPKTGGNIEPLYFQVQARGILSGATYPFSYDIRIRNSKVRGTPALLKTPGDFIKPGQIVRYAWSQTGGGEKFPKVEAVFAGQTAQATGLQTSIITQVLGTRVMPIVLGHYLMTVTPRDVRGEPPRGSTSNGQVFRCAFGTDNLPPVTDGFTGDDFTPSVGQTITLQPVAVDPETGQSVFDNQTYDFGDGTIISGVSGATTHTYMTPGIFGVRCTMADNMGLTATAVDNVVVGGENVTKLAFTAIKSVVADEAGDGDPYSDSCTVTFNHIQARAGDRIIFTYNRNRFGRTSASDAGSDADIVLQSGGTFSGSASNVKNIAITSTGSSVTLVLTKAQFDRTGDPRLGRSEPNGIFRNQRIALCVIPADGSSPRVQVYTGNMRIKVIGGSGFRNLVLEHQVKCSATTNEPNPRKQEAY